MREHIGQRLNYTETSYFGPEGSPNGVLTGSNRPQLTTNKGREFFAQVTMSDGLIAEVK